MAISDPVVLPIGRSVNIEDRYVVDDDRGRLYVHLPDATLVATAELQWQPAWTSN